MRKALHLFGSVGLTAAVLAAGLAATRSPAHAAGEQEKPAATTQEVSPDEGGTRASRLRSLLPQFFGRQTSVAVSVAAEAEDGFVVGSIDEDSPLGEAGVERGDIILAVGDAEINTSADLHNAFDTLEPGDTLTLRVQHGDEVKTVTLIVPEEGAGALMGATPCGGGRGFGGHGFGMFEKSLEIRNGASVGGLAEDGPATNAGIVEGDRIVSLNGEEIATAAELVEAVAALSPGDTVTLELASETDDPAVTDAARREVDLTLGAHPDDSERAFLGVQLVPGLHRLHGAMPLKPGMGAFPFPTDGDFTGTFVMQLADDGPAAAAGLTEGDLIVAIDGSDVNSPEDVKAAIVDHAPGDTVSITVRTADDETTRDVTVTLGARPDDEDAAYLGIGLGFMTRKISPDGGLPGAAFEGIEEFAIPFGSEGFAEQGAGPGRMFRFRVPQSQPAAPVGSGSA